MPLRISIILLLLCAFVSRSVAAPAAKAASTTSKPVVAVFELTGSVTETPPDEMAAIFGEPGDSLRDLVARMQKAADDPSVKAVVVMDDDAAVGFAQIEELREAIKKVRDAGKEVYAHSDSMNLGQ